MIFAIPNQPSLAITTIILDLNGTLCVGGKLVSGVRPRLARLQKLGLKLVLFSADTRGQGQKIARSLGIKYLATPTSQAKANAVQEFNPQTCASIGNGLIDLELTKLVKLGVVTLQAEGVHIQTLRSAHIVVPVITDALDLFIDPARLIATLRT